MPEYLKVLLWANVDSNPDGVPDVWPAAVNASMQSEEVQAPWVKMTVAEYEAYKATHQVAYDAWAATPDSAHRRDTIRELIKSRAYALETAGMEINGTQVNTDRLSQAMIGNALAYLTLNPNELIDWQAADDTYVSLGKAQVEGLATAVGAHVQAHFTRRKELMLELDETSDANLTAFQAKVIQFWE